MSSPDDSASGLLGVSGAFIGICTIAVALRFYTRRRLGIPYAADDWCMLATLVAVRPYPKSEAISITQTADILIVTSDVALYIAFGLTKASALLLYRRIFCKTGSSLKKGLEYTIYGTLVVIVMWSIAFCFLAGFQCGTHLLDSYKTEVSEKYCKLGPAFAYGTMVSDLILDVWVIVLPIPSILALHAPLGRKIMTIGLFLVASVGVIASAIRLANLVDGLVRKTTLTTRPMPFSKLTMTTVHINKFPTKEVEDLPSTLFFYNALEIGMFVVSINMVVLWGLFTKIVPEHVVKMARSISSLVSVSSSQHGSRHDTHNQGNGSGNDTSLRKYSDSFRMGSVERGTHGRAMTESYATHDADGPVVPEDQKEHILVNETFRVDSTSSREEEEEKGGFRRKYAEGEV